MTPKKSQRIGKKCGVRLRIRRGNNGLLPMHERGYKFESATLLELEKKLLAIAKGELP